MISSNYFCAFLSLNLMWRHLKEPIGRQQPQRLPTTMYIKATVFILVHALFDLMALTAYFLSISIPAYTANDAKLNFLLNRVSLTMVGYQVAFFPFVFRIVRDLKFSARIRAQSNVSPNNSATGWKPIKNIKLIFGSYKRSNEPNTAEVKMEPFEGGMLFSREAVTTVPTPDSPV